MSAEQKPSEQGGDLNQTAINQPIEKVQEPDSTMEVQEPRRSSMRIQQLQLGHPINAPNTQNVRMVPPQNSEEMINDYKLMKQIDPNLKETMNFYLTTMTEFLKLPGLTADQKKQFDDLKKEVEKHMEVKERKDDKDGQKTKDHLDFYSNKYDMTLVQNVSNIIPGIFNGIREELKKKDEVIKKLEAENEQMKSQVNLLNALKSNSNSFQKLMKRFCEIYPSGKDSIYYKIFGNEREGFVDLPLESQLGYLSSVFEELPKVYEKVIPTLEDIVNNVHMADKPREYPQRVALVERLEDRFNALRDGLEENRKSAALHRDVSNARFSMVSAGGNTFERHFQEAESNLNRSIDGEEANRFEGILADLRHKMMCSFTEGREDLKLLEALCALSSVDKVYSEHLTKKVEEATKEFDQHKAKWDELFSAAVKRLEDKRKDEEERKRKEEEEKEEEERRSRGENTPLVDSRKTGKSEEKPLAVSGKMEEDKKLDKIASKDSLAPQLQNELEAYENRREDQNPLEELKKKLFRLDKSIQALDDVEERDALLNSEEYRDTTDALRKQIDLETEKVHYERHMNIVESITKRECRELFNLKNVDMNEPINTEDYPLKKVFGYVYIEENNRLQKELAEAKAERDSLKQLEEKVGSIQQLNDELTKGKLESGNKLKEQEQKLKKYENFEGKLAEMQKLQQEKDKLQKEKEYLENSIKAKDEEIANRNKSIGELHEKLATNAERTNELHNELLKEREVLRDQHERERSALDEERMKVRSKIDELNKMESEMKARERDVRNSNLRAGRVVGEEQNRSGLLAIGRDRSRSREGGDVFRADQSVLQGLDGNPRESGMMDASQVTVQRAPGGHLNRDVLSQRQGDVSFEDDRPATRRQTSRSPVQRRDGGLDMSREMEIQRNEIMKLRRDLEAKKRELNEANDLIAEKERQLKDADPDGWRQKYEASRLKVQRLELANSRGGAVVHARERRWFDSILPWISLILFFLSSWLYYKYQESDSRLHSSKSYAKNYV
jgi:hypothetical protein